MPRAKRAAGFDYQRYLASREWGLKKRAVHKRAGGHCERCGAPDIAAVHHTTYERVGDEDLEDLLAVCRPCHDFLGGISDFDPTKPPDLDLLVAGWVLLFFDSPDRPKSDKAFHIWEAIFAADREGRRIDALTIGRHLEQEGMLSRVGGWDALVELGRSATDFFYPRRD